jgi:hypothetical protein
MSFADFDGEPTVGELREIEAEWPSIEADMRSLDDELSVARVERRGVRRERRLGQLLPALSVVRAAGRAA